MRRKEEQEGFNRAGTDRTKRRVKEKNGEKEKSGSKSVRVHERTREGWLGYL